MTRTFCTYCRNTGFVRIWSLEAMRALRDAATAGDIYHPQRHQVTTVRCCCDVAKNRQFPKAVFDPRCMCPEDNNLRQFIESRTAELLF